MNFSDGQKWMKCKNIPLLEETVIARDTISHFLTVLMPNNYEISSLVSGCFNQRYRY